MVHNTGVQSAKSHNILMSESTVKYTGVRRTYPFSHKHFSCFEYRPGGCHITLRVKRKHNMSGEATDKIELIIETSEIWLNYGGLSDV